MSMTKVLSCGPPGSLGNHSILNLNAFMDILKLSDRI